MTRAPLACHPPPPRPSSPPIPSKHGLAVRVGASGATRATSFSSRRMSRWMLAAMFWYLCSLLRRAALRRRRVPALASVAAPAPSGSSGRGEGVSGLTKSFQTDHAFPCRPLRAVFFSKTSARGQRGTWTAKWASWKGMICLGALCDCARKAPRRSGRARSSLRRRRTRRTPGRPCFRRRRARVSRECRALLGPLRPRQGASEADVAAGPCLV